MPKRKTLDLRKGRVSIPGARYFIKAGVKNRAPVLAKSAHFEKSRVFLDFCQISDIALSLGFTLMPDHAHWLFRLGRKTSLDQVLRMFKFHVGIPLRKQGYFWQDNFFEHRLRAKETAESYGRYIFLNPYRAGLISFREVWPYWEGNRESRYLFEASLIDGKYPPSAWLDEVHVHPVEVWKSDPA